MNCQIIIIFIIAFLLIINLEKINEKFSTLSALNFASAARSRQLRYYDSIYGYDPKRWIRNSMFGTGTQPSYYGGIYPQFQPAGLYGFQNRFQGSRDLKTGKRIY